MIYVATFEFVVPTTIRFQSFSGFSVRGFFYKIMGIGDQRLAEELHAGKALAPFSVTPVTIEAAGRELVSYDRLDPGLARFSLVMMRPELGSSLQKALQGGLSSITLSDQELPLASIRLESLDPLAIPEEPVKSFELNFWTPTFFRATPLDLSKQYGLSESLTTPYRYVPLPDPILTFRSLVRTWREFVGSEGLEELMTWVESGGIVLSGFPTGIYTRRVYEHPMGNKWVVGFVGRTRFSASSPLYSERMASLASKLLKFGEICGVGGGRTSGLGRYRMTSKPQDELPQEELPPDAPEGL